jgi:hypothetical protein
MLCRIGGTLLQRCERAIGARFSAVGVQYAPDPGTVAYYKETPLSTSFHARSATAFGIPDHIALKRMRAISARSGVDALSLRMRWWDATERVVLSN